MTLPIEKEISVLAGGPAVVPGAFSKPVAATGDWDTYSESGIFTTTATMTHGPGFTGDYTVVVQRYAATAFQLALTAGAARARSATIAGSTVTWGTWSDWNDDIHAGHAVYEENVTSDVTINLEDKWANWQNRVVLFTTSGGTAPVVTIQPNAAGTWTPPATDRHSNILFHPMQKGMQIRVKNIAFARHDSDGRVSEHAKSATAINVTEGFGEPFRLIYSIYYVDSTLYAWHVAPIVQDVRNVIDDYDQDAVRQNELKTVEAKVDHLIIGTEGSHSVPMWPTFNLPSISGYETKTYSPSSFGTIKIVGSKGDHNLYLETTFSGGATQRDSLGGILRQEGIQKGDWLNDRAFIYVAPTFASGTLNGADLAFSFDVASGRMESPLPIDVEITPTATVSSGRNTYTNLLRIVGYDETVGEVWTNAIDPAGTNAVAGTDKLRLFSSSDDLETARELIEDHLGATGRGVVTLSPQDTDGWETFHVTAISTTTTPTSSTADVNRLLPRADLTVTSPAARKVPDQRKHLRLHLEDISVSVWAEAGNDETIPSSKLPHGQGADSRGQLIATSQNFRKADPGSSILQMTTFAFGVAGNVVPITFTLGDAALSSVYTPIGYGVRTPLTRRIRNQVGYHIDVEAVSSGEVVATGYVPFAPRETTRVIIPDSSDNHAVMRFELFETDSMISTAAATIGGYYNLSMGAEAASNERNFDRADANFSDREFFRVRIYEWIDTAANPESTPSGGDAGTVGSFDILRRIENLSASLAGNAVELGGSAGYVVDTGATHLEVSVTAPANMNPSGPDLEYLDPGDGTTWRNLYADGAADLLELTAGELTGFRAGPGFLHTDADGVTRRLRLRVKAASGETLSGDSLGIELAHLKDTNSAASYPLELLTTKVSVPSQALNADLGGSTWTDVELDVPVIYDQVESLDIGIRIFDSASTASEDADNVLSVTRNRMDWVGHTPGDLPSARPIKGWFAKGWGANGHANAINAWSDRPSAAYVFNYANDGTTVPSRILAIKLDGAYLTTVRVATYVQPCIITHVSCLRRL